MKPLGLNEIREKYLKFFEGKEHLRLASFPLVPQNDNSLLLINSGMAPLKAYFTGQEVPPSERVATCQKCIRTGDIENVGKTTRHGTFFEMLGNFSFGNYFKEEIIPWSWEFVTKVMEIPEDRLYVSVYEDDDESIEIWNKKVGVPREKIYKLGKADNFWEHGLGPCGPCSEIYYDKGEEYGCKSENCSVGCDCDRYMEFWNLVFTQFNREEDGSYSNLAKPNIDTGMGLERIAAMMQNTESIFDIDTIKVIRDKVCRLANVTYKQDADKDVSIRIITDHIRSVTFMTSDGVLPSNEGRGYVLRRLLRRAARHGKKLGIQGKFLTELSKAVISVSKDAYKELLEKQDYIFTVLSVEEDRFYDIIDNGIDMLKKHISTLRETSQKVLTGEEAFKLYDTFGVPVDLMKEILEEEGLTIDEESFKEKMEDQRTRARSAREESSYMGAKETVFNKIPVDLTTNFDGYDKLELQNAKVTVLATDTDLLEKADAKMNVSVITDKTPIYAESGGQRGDAGRIVTKTGIVQINDCIKIVGNKFAHIGEVIEGYVSVGDEATICVEKKRRMATARNHSATHLLQKALRDVLGNHVQQAGSFVSEDRLRFDFTHFSTMAAAELKVVEKNVNEKILEALDITWEVKSIDEARKMGAMALFGEKYGEEVRVIKMGDYSIELCGGTHLRNTAQVGVFKIVSESGIAAGVRRIEAVTGTTALEYYAQLENKIHSLAALTKTTPDNLSKKVETLLNQNKDLQKEIEKISSKMSSGVIDEIWNSKDNIKGINSVVAKVDNIDANALRTMGDRLKDKIKSGVIVLISSKEGKVNLLSMATDDVISSGIHAGNIIKAVATVVGGGGGGRPNMAQAGGKDASKIDDALLKAKEIITEMVK